MKKTTPTTLQAGIVFISLFLLVSLTSCSGKTLKNKGATDRDLECSSDADNALKQLDYVAAIRLHHGVLKKDPRNALAAYHLGYAYGQTGDHEREILHYEKAVALGINRGDVFFNLGMAYGELNRLGEAHRTFKRGLAVDPNNGDNYFGMAVVYQKRGDLIRAEKAFIEALRLDPDHLDARWCLGMLYLERGEKQEAARHLRHILNTDPRHESARDLLQGLEME